jgi:CcmD family protein
VEQLPATPLVFSAYAFVWVALVVYVFTMWRRVTRLETELRRVQARTGSPHRP